jgi:hypothetical protein
VQDRRGAFDGVFDGNFLCVREAKFGGGVLVMDRGGGGRWLVRFRLQDVRTLETEEGRVQRARPTGNALKGKSQDIYPFSVIHRVVCGDAALGHFSLWESRRSLSLPKL